MPEPRRVTVELSDYLTDLTGAAMKGLLSAPIAWRADRLIDALPRRYGQVSHSELISALIHGTEPDAAALSLLIEDYREDQAWRTFQGFASAPTRHSGPWEVPLRASGQRGT